MTGILLGIAIGLYTGYVIYRTIRQLKSGDSCCGGCNQCSKREGCRLEKKDDK